MTLDREIRSELVSDCMFKLNIGCFRVVDVPGWLMIECLEQAWMAERNGSVELAQVLNSLISAKLTPKGDAVYDHILDEALRLGYLTGDDEEKDRVIQFRPRSADRLDLA